MLFSFVEVDILIATKEIELNTEETSQPNHVNKMSKKNKKKNKNQDWGDDSNGR